MTPHEIKQKLKSIKHLRREAEELLQDSIKQHEEYVHYERREKSFITPKGFEDQVEYPGLEEVNKKCMLVWGLLPSDLLAEKEAHSILRILYRSMRFSSASKNSRVGDWLVAYLIVDQCHDAVKLYSLGTFLKTVDEEALSELYIQKAISLNPKLLAPAR